MTIIASPDSVRQIPIFPQVPARNVPAGRPTALKNAALGRSHRAKIGKTKLEQAIELTREVLQVPADYRIGIVPASDTGAVEMAMWSLLGAARRRHGRLGKLRRGLGHRCGQAAEARRCAHASRRPMANCPISLAVDFDRDVVFTWNGTTSGVRVPNGDFIPADRKGLTICDATSAAFAQRLDFAEARCRHLLLAEGAGRRGRARHADPVARARSSGWKATSRPGRCRRSSA